MLAGLAGLAASVATARAQAPASPSPASPSPANPRRIDVHHHILPPVYRERAHDRLIASSSTMPQGPIFGWTPAATLEQMDRFGIATAMTSVSAPGIWFGDRQTARDLARACNEYAVRLGTDHPGRFGTLIALPLPDVDGSLAEIAYCFDTLKVDGVCLMTSYDNKWPGDPAFAPVFDELNRRRAVVFFHPNTPACCANLIPDIDASTLEFPFDSTRALLSMMSSGTLARCPELRCVFSHTGGATSALAGRIDGLFVRTPSLLERVPGGAMAMMKRQYYDIATSVNPATMAAALTAWGPGQLVFGSDNPFVPIAATASSFDHFSLPDDQRAAIDRGNALKLFPRFGA